MSAMMGRMVAPDRKGHAALLELKMILAEEAHRHLLWHWRTVVAIFRACLLYTSPSPRDRQKSRMPSSA